MSRWATDQNFNGKILRGVLRRKPDLDIVRVQDTEMLDADDPAVLAWATAENRLTLTHDVNTLVGYAYERIAAGQHTTGVFAVQS